MDLLEIGLNVLDWIGLAQDRYRWRALVNAVMNFRVPLNAKKYRVTTQLVGSPVVLSSTELVSYYQYFRMNYNIEIEMTVSVEWIHLAQD
jgi:hypothetical protein